MITTNSAPSDMLRAMALCALLTSALFVGCDEAPPPPPPPAKPAPAKEAPTAPAPAKAPAPAEPTPAPAPVAAEPAPVVEAKPALASASASGDRARLLAHYHALRCLSARGASADEVAQAFTSAGLSPDAWERALADALSEMAQDPDGEVAEALRAARSQPCGAGGTP